MGKYEIHGISRVVGMFQIRLFRSADHCVPNMWSTWMGKTMMNHWIWEPNDAPKPALPDPEIETLQAAAVRNYSS